MRTLVALLLALVTGLPAQAATTAGCPCPAPKKVTRPAPKKKPAPPVAPKGGQDIPVPIPPKPIVQIKEVVKLIEVPVPGPVREVQVPGPVVLVPETPRGRLVLPISAFKVGPTKGAAVGLGYQFRNRMILSAQAVLADSDSISSLTRANTLVTLTDSDGDGNLPSHCTDGHGRDGEHNPHCQGGDDDDPSPTIQKRVSSSSSRDRDRDTGIMVTLTVPLGR
jgi:hypothetical protein